MPAVTATNHLVAVSKAKSVSDQSLGVSLMPTE